MNYKKIIFVFIALSIISFFIFIVTSNKNNSESNSCLSLTFDDGYKNHYETVVPLLKKYNFTATFFIPTNHYKFGSDWLLNKSDIEELIFLGHEIGSHSISHPYLTNISYDELYKEVVISKKTLDEDFNISVKSFAFPYSDYNKDVLNFVNKNYENVRLKSYVLKKDSDYKNACSEIKKAKILNKQIIFMLHDVRENPGIWGTTTEDFKNILACINESNIAVATFNNCNK
jgi:peptidoglycan/xylan/chitin deacetylase (PgdA/CDA1 family)